MYPKSLKHLEKSTVKNVDFWASYGLIWAILATRDEIGRARFGPLRPYHWS